MNKITAIVCLFLITLFTSCGKEENWIQDVPVDISLLVDNQVPGVRAPGGVEVLNRGGIAGIILYNYGGKILAYDRCSSVNPNMKNPVDYLGGDLVIDKASGALFSLIDGSARKEPAVKSLKRYLVSLNGGILRIQN